MSQLVLNSPVTMCCGLPAGQCSCGAIPADTEFASNAELDSITGHRAPTVANTIPTIDDGDMLGLPTFNWAEIAQANHED